MWVMVSGCQCNHLIGAPNADAGDSGCGTGGGGGGSSSDCRAGSTNGDTILCPYGDLVSLANQPCDRSGQLCRSPACSQSTCSAQCFEGICQPSTCAWKASSPKCGVDAGTDAGGCKYPADCPTLGLAAICAFSPPSTAVPSCIDQRCIDECPGSRICTTSPNDAGLCLSCGGLSDCPDQCGKASSGTLAINSVSCRPAVDAGILSQVSGWVSTVPASCNYDVAPLGTMSHLTSGNSLGNFPALGGTCTGKNLVTGVPRTQWFCPLCSFVMEGWE
jgi:hypothetical protein